MGTGQSELINSLLLGKNGIGAQEMEKRRLVCGRPPTSKAMNAM
jgi:hypothetical protein